MKNKEKRWIALLCAMVMACCACSAALAAGDEVVKLRV